jgi:hypothetical protein
MSSNSSTAQKTAQKAATPAHVPSKGAPSGEGASKPAKPARAKRQGQALSPHLVFNLAVIAGAGEGGMPVMGRGVKSGLHARTATALRQPKLIELFEKGDQTWARILPAGMTALEGTVQGEVLAPGKASTPAQVPAKESDRAEGAAKAPKPARAKRQRLARTAAAPAPRQARRRPEPTPAPAPATSTTPAPEPGPTRGSGHRDPDNRRPPVGTILRREYHGKVHHVTVLESGYRYEGQEYKALSPIAKLITGQEANGWRWFGLKPAHGAPGLSARNELDQLLARVAAMVLAPTDADQVRALADTLERHGRPEAAARLRETLNEKHTQKKPARAA